MNYLTTGLNMLKYLFGFIIIGLSISCWPYGESIVDYTY